VSAKAVNAEGIAAAPASSVIQVKGRVGNRNVTDAVETAAAAFTAEVAAVLTVAGIAAGRCAILERGVVNGGGAGDPSAAALGASAPTSVLLVTDLVGVAAIPAGGVVVVDSRAVDVECAAPEIDRTTLTT
jgi:hypothetical protein